jgi:hypothetical protein
VIFVGDDWSEQHHDVYVRDPDGRQLARQRLAEGLDGIAGLHGLLAEHADHPSEVVIGIETDRGLWVTALVAAGYTVYAITPRRRHATATATACRARSPTPATPRCSPSWSAPTATTTDQSRATATSPTVSRCSPGRIRT